MHFAWSYIWRSLIAAGIMKSFRGVDGGFALNRDPQEISLLDVIRAVEGDAYLQRCLYDVGSCSKSCMGHCAINEAMGTIQDQLINQLEMVNFKTLAQREQLIESEANIYLSLVVCAVHTRHDSDCSYLGVDICVYW